MRKLKTMGYIALAAIILILIVLEIFVGFPFEHIIAKSIARRYVTETYGLTPTKTQASILLEHPISVTVWVEEKPYDFDVKMNRFTFTVILDNYLIRTAEYILGKDLNDYVADVTNQNGRALVRIFNTQIKDFSLSDVEENPGIVFEKAEWYYCSIVLYDDLTQKNYDIDYALVYSIYKKIFELGLNPKYLYIDYDDKNGKEGKTILSVRIDKDQFPSINSPEDLKPFFKKAIQKLDQKQST